ncbi:hypothetical protein ANN_01138 [Periplaneta americana]|uniref:Uncharacterized protein n=1 Tax=Periplaneta americana TaxID=6978 RepID=A0ABQ8TW42_PERAM|nr:hypothetical protein ANN_01138 [Periplaneta americana]
MAGLCEGGNEPPGSLKAIAREGPSPTSRLLASRPQAEVDDHPTRMERARHCLNALSLGFSEVTHTTCEVQGPSRTNPDYTRDYRSTGGPPKLLAFSTGSVDCIHVMMDSFYNGTRGRPSRGGLPPRTVKGAFGGGGCRSRNGTWTLVGEERMMLKLIRKRKRNWLDHWLRRNCLLKDALKGMVNGRRVRGRRRYQMIDDIKIYGSYEETKRKAENRKDRRKLDVQ